MKNFDFRYRLFYGLIHDCFEYQINNKDYLRFNIKLSGRIKNHIKDIVFHFLKKLGFIRQHFDMMKVKNNLKTYIQEIDKLEEVYHLLGDDYSKSLFIELLKFRTLNEKHVKLSVNNKSYWDKYYSVNRKYLIKKGVIDSGCFILNSYAIEGSNGVIKLIAHPLGILTVFLLEQYTYKKKGKQISVEAGDVVIDGGSCWGETSLYFADKVGSSGKVYAFEFVEDNLDILHRNMCLNKHLSERITIEKKVIWNISEQTINYSPCGPGTSILSSEGQQNYLQQVTTITIDDLVAEKGIPKVDFIKMDIEGSELYALMGAQKTLKKFKPKLSISIYHKDEDFIQIPKYLNGLGLGYEFYLDHFTIHREETVLFACS